jgi:Flavodoxin domain
MLMRVVIVYESMFGTTRSIADEIGKVAASWGEAAVVPVAEATSNVLENADLVIVGGPTHVHGLSWPTTRSEAEAESEKYDALVLDPDAEGPGLRDWFHQVGDVDNVLAAAFDTRLNKPEVVTGRASKGIDRRLRHHGYRTVVEPESFLVDKENHLVDGEADRARAWAQSLFDHLAAED